MASSRFSSSPTNLWDPWQEFEIINSDYRDTFTCMGQTQKKNRCKNTIGVRTGESLRILRQLAVREPSAADMNDELEELAQSSCCGKWRHYHAPGAAVRFKRIVANLEETRRQSRSPAFRFGTRTPTSHTEGSSNSSIGGDTDRWDFGSTRPHTNRPAPPRTTRSSRNTTPSTSPATDDTIAALLQTIRNMRTDHVAEMRQLSREAAQNAARVRRLVRERDELQREVERLREQIVDINETESDTDSDAESDAESESDFEPVERACSERHVPRRPIDADCGICLESMADSPAHELVWCKKVCGKSVHQECFETWREGRTIPRCVHCRGEWSGSCAHDNILPRNQ